MDTTGRVIVPAGGAQAGDDRAGVVRTGVVRTGIVLAGGRASRVDGADKALFTVDGAALLVRAVDALAGCGEIIVVGPESGRPALPGVRWTREDPPFAGPVAALARALAETDADELIVLPADLPGAAHATALLEAAALGEDDGIVLVDDAGHPQWLTARYRTAPLRAAIAASGASSVRGVVAGLRLRRLPAPPAATKDIDTWDDLHQARADAVERNTMSETPPLPPAALTEWVAAAAAEAGVDPAAVDIALVLDLARDAAHGVARPAAPVTAFIAGLAAGAGADAADVIARLTARAETWSAE